MPDDIVLPPGGEYRVNIKTGRKQARWDNSPGPETVIDRRRRKPQERHQTGNVAAQKNQLGADRFSSTSNGNAPAALKRNTLLSKAQKIDVLLPSGPVSFSDTATKIFPVLANRRRYFVRDRLLVEIAYKKLMKDKQLHDVFQLLEPDAFRIRIEDDFRCWVWREDHGKYIRKPSRCTNDAARVLLKSDAAFHHLPAIRFLSAQPVYTSVQGDLEVLYRGYHDLHGGIYVSHGDKQRPVILPELQIVIALIVDVVKDYDFLSPSDKSRAIASFISPALRVGKFLDDADFPIDIAEANESQGGKTYRLKLVCAIYGETPYIIANREGGVGSLDESISSALVAEVPFILFENFRGRMNSQLVETCLRGTGTAPARIPHKGEVQVSTADCGSQVGPREGETGDVCKQCASRSMGVTNP